MIGIFLAIVSLRYFSHLVLTDILVAPFLRDMLFISCKLRSPPTSLYDTWFPQIYIILFDNPQKKVINLSSCTWDMSLLKKLLDYLYIRNWKLSPINGIFLIMWLKSQTRIDIWLTVGGKMPFPLWPNQSSIKFNRVVNFAFVIFAITIYYFHTLKWLYFIGYIKGWK